MVYNRAMRSIIFELPRFLIIDIIGDIIYFPFWWYTKGLVRFFKNYIRRLRAHAVNTAVLLWVKNLFVPMFGQRDIAGKLISFFARLTQIIARAIFLAALFLWETALLFLWITIPFFVLGEILYHLSALFNISLR